MEVEKVLELEVRRELAKQSRRKASSERLESVEGEKNRREKNRVN